MVFLITIAGGSGSGKTTVANDIIKKTGKKNVLLISLDNYYKDFSKMKNLNRANINFDHPNAIDWDLLKSHITDLLNFMPVKMPNYSFVKCGREKYTHISPKKIVILEGIFALFDDYINKKSSLRIFVETDSDVRFIRRIKRDVIERKLPIKKNIDMWLRYVKPMYEQFIEPTKRNAHILIPEDQEGNMRDTAIDLIKTKAESFLKRK